MNSSQGTPQKRPAPAGQRRPAPRPTGNAAPSRNPKPSTTPRPSGYRRAPEEPNRRPPQNRPAARPAPQINYTRPRRNRPSDDFLMLCILVLSVLLAALMITFFILKASSCSGEGGESESTPDPSVEAGINAPPQSTEPPASLKEWQISPEDPKAFKPVSDESTITLSSSKIYSNNIIMMEVSSGRSVCEYGADTRIYPASMTKLMTVIVACDLIEDMNDTFVFTTELLYSIESGATQAYFKAGNPVPMVDLIYGAILPSGADACLGLAISLAGTEEEFVSLMNKKALELGCYSTHFMNVSGLHHEEHYSTVRDMAAIMAYAMENPFLRKVISARSYTTVAPVDRADGTLYCNWQSGAAADASSEATMFGAKSGYTDKAGRCLASISKTPDGKEYIIVSAGAFANDQKLGAEQSFADVRYLCDNYIK